MLLLYIHIYIILYYIIYIYVCMYVCMIIIYIYIVVAILCGGRTCECYTMCDWFNRKLSDYTTHIGPSSWSVIYCCRWIGVFAS